MWWRNRRLSPHLKEMKEENGEKAQREEQVEDEEIFPWETDYQLLVCGGLFDEYLEMGESWGCWMIGCVVFYLNLVHDFSL